MFNLSDNEDSNIISDEEFHEKLDLYLENLGQVLSDDDIDIMTPYVDMKMSFDFDWMIADSGC